MEENRGNELPKKMGDEFEVQCNIKKQLEVKVTVVRMHTSQGQIFLSLRCMKEERAGKRRRNKRSMYNGIMDLRKPEGVVRNYALQLRNVEVMTTHFPGNLGYSR